MLQSKPGEARRRIHVAFLYLDLNVCTRCQGTDEVLDEAVRELAPILEAVGIDLLVRKVNVDTAEAAHRHRFMSSPTIRVDGRDIDPAGAESLCESCGDLCGDAVDCRDWTWRGRKYPRPPKAMILDALLRAAYGTPAASTGGGREEQEDAPYRMPANLARFYAAMDRLGRGKDPEEGTPAAGCGCGPACRTGRTGREDTT